MRSSAETWKAAEEMSASAVVLLRDITASSTPSEVREAAQRADEAARALHAHAHELTEDAADPKALLYSASSRCACGAGLAYIVSRRARQAAGWSDAWVCSKVLLGEVETRPAGSKGGFESRGVDANGQEHVLLPWAFYEIKSERDGLTTRPA